jgi:hypothetical protein
MKRFSRGRELGLGGPVRHEELNLGGLRIPRQARAGRKYQQAGRAIGAITGMAGSQMRKDAAIQMATAEADMEAAYIKSFETDVINNPDAAETWDKNATAAATKVKDTYLKSGDTLTNFLLGPFGSVDEEREELLDARLKNLTATHQRRIQEGRVKATTRSYIKLQTKRSQNFKVSLAAAESKDEELYVRKLEGEEFKKNADNIRASIIPLGEQNRLIAAAAADRSYAIMYNAIDKRPAEVETNFRLSEFLVEQSPYSKNLNAEHRRVMDRAAKAGLEKLEGVVRRHQTKEALVQTNAVRKAFEEFIDAANGEGTFEDKVTRLKNFLSLTKGAVRRTEDGVRTDPKTGKPIKKYLFEKNAFDALNKEAIMMIAGPHLRHISTTMQIMAVDQDEDPRGLRTTEDLEGNAQALLTQSLGEGNTQDLLNVLSIYNPTLVADVEANWQKSAETEGSIKGKYFIQHKIQDLGARANLDFGKVVEDLTKLVGTLKDDPEGRAKVIDFLRTNYTQKFQETYIDKARLFIGVDQARDEAKKYDSKLGAVLKNLFNAVDVEDLGLPQASDQSIEGMGALLIPAHQQGMANAKARNAQRNREEQEEQAKRFAVADFAVENRKQISSTLRDQLIVGVNQQFALNGMTAKERVAAIAAINVSYTGWNGMVASYDKLKRGNLGQGGLVSRGDRLKLISDAREQARTTHAVLMALVTPRDSFSKDLDSAAVAAEEKFNIQLTDLAGHMLRMKGAPGYVKKLRAGLEEVQKDLDRVQNAYDRKRPENAGKTLSAMGFTSEYMQAAFKNPQSAERANLRATIAMAPGMIGGLEEHGKLLINLPALEQGSPEERAQTALEMVNTAEFISRMYVYHADRNQVTSKWMQDVYAATIYSRTKPSIVSTGDQTVSIRARTIAEGMELKDLYKVVTSSSPKDRLDRSLLSGFMAENGIENGSEGAEALKSVVREFLLQTNGWHENNKPWASLQPMDLGMATLSLYKPSVENISNIGVIINDIVDQARYMVVPTGRDYNETVAETLLSGLLAARQTDGRYGVTRVTAGVRSQIGDKIYRTHHYRYAINPMEAHLGDHMNGALALSWRHQDSTRREGNELRDAQSEVSRAYVALSFFQKMAADHGPQGPHHRDIGWLRSQLTPGAINGMFQELGPKATVLFVNELNSIVEQKHLWGEKLYDLNKPVSTTFGGKDVMFLDAPQVQVGGDTFAPSIFQPVKPSIGEDILGYAPSNLIVHAAASEQGLGMVPRRDSNGQVVFNATALTVKSKVKFTAGRDFGDTLVQGALDDPGLVGTAARGLRDFVETGKDLTTLVRPSGAVFTIYQPTGDPALDPDDAQSRFAARLIRAIKPAN